MLVPIEAPHYTRKFNGYSKSVSLQPSGPPRRSLSRFPCSMERLRVLLLPPWRKYWSIARLPTNISSGFPDNFPVPIYTPGGREAWWVESVLLINTSHWRSQVSNPDLSTHSPVHWPFVHCISQYRKTVREIWWNILG